MRSRLLALIVAAALLCGQPAAAAVAFVRAIGTSATAATSGTTVTLTGVTTNNGDLYVLLIRTNSGVTGVTCADSSSANTFTTGVASAVANGGKLWMSYVKNGVALSAATITCTTNATITTAAMLGLEFSGTNLTAPLDVTSTPQGCSSSCNAAINPNVVINSGVIAQADEVVVGGVVYAGTIASYNPNPGGGPSAFTQGQSNQQSGGNAFVSADYFLAASTNTITYGSTWSVAHAWNAQLWTFKGVSVSTANCKNMTMLGAGSC